MNSKPPLIHADTLRRTLRLIHCLQRERGPSCAPLENHDFMIQSRLDTNHAMKDCHNICLGDDAPIRPVLEKIRTMIDARTISSHRTLVCFTTLISSVLHEHVLRYTSKATSTLVSKQAKDESTPKAQNGFSRIQSLQNFQSIASEDMSQAKKPPRRQRSKSIGLSSFGVVTDKPFDPADFVPLEYSSHDVAVDDDNDYVDLEATTPGVPIHQATDEQVTSLRLSSLSQLLRIFVCIKESTGKERASLYSMLATHQAPSDADFLLGDVVMEVENQRRQLEQLQHVKNHPLQNLVQELVLMSEDMQQVQNLLSSGCLLDSIKEYYSARQLWDVLTVYMDKLHSLELLIVEEMELALPVTFEAVLENQNHVEASILADAFDATTPLQLEQAIQAMTPDEVKRRLLRALKCHTQPTTILEETRDEQAMATKGLDEVMKDLYGNVPAMKEWEIDVYELKFLKRIGQGAAGTTYLADWSGENVAVKVASITELGLDGWRTEVQALQKLHHPNIIRLLGSVYHQHPLTFCLVLEYCDAGDLASALTKTVPADFFFHVATSMSKGLVYLHHRNVIHRDIKPHNVLLHGDLASGHYQVKVTDFGVAADLTNLEDRAAETGTYRWMAPEVIRHDNYTETADVYSFGIIMWQLITREEPFANLGQIEAAAVVAMEFARPVFPTDTPPPIKDLIERCWAEDPLKRPSVSEILLELNALRFDLDADARKWLDAPLGHAVYRKRVTVPTIPEDASQSPVLITNQPDARKKKKFGLFARKSSHF